MICQKCGKNNAEIYYKQTINGKTEEYALCSHCAEALKKEGKLDMKMPSLFDELGFGIGGKSIYGLEELFGLPASKTVKTRSEKKRCTLCSSTFDELVKNGRVGCAQCYKVFSDELRNSIESIHGKALYVGRGTEKTVKEETGKTQENNKENIEKLKKELEKAIYEQEFEKAAVLRDKIKAAESSKEEN
ncbi:MAG: UvrB/UvrC motif-containing protein [Clostridia bacterium]|nr:UvrB/UvrC motif-containing protein [Clostridia bacterium]